MEEKIRIENVTKKFGSYAALDGISLSFEKGKIHGMIGRNGSGKTVLFKCICGFLRVDDGAVLVDGKQIGKEIEAPESIGAIIETPGFLPGYSARQNLQFLAGIRRKIGKKEIDEAIRKVGLDPEAKKHVGKYSLGMRQRLGIAQAIMEEPSLLILDEPLDGLDPVMRKQIWTILMSEVAERRTTVLVSSHNLRELEDVCDHVGIMNHGKVIIERSLFDLHGNISKIQVACQTGMPKLPKEFEVLHMSNSGRVYTMIVKGNPREVAAAIQTEGDHLAIVDILPLTLEEIFIYEMGGLGYEVKDILF